MGAAKYLPRLEGIGGFPSSRCLHSSADSRGQGMPTLNTLFTAVSGPQAFPQVRQGQSATFKEGYGEPGGGAHL